MLSEAFASNEYKLYTWSIAEYIASLPFTLAAAFVFQVVFHWLAGLNDDFDAFIYAVLLAFVLQNIMDSFGWVQIEIFQDAMLAVTACILYLGVLFLFSGFFIPVTDTLDVLFSLWLSKA